MYYCISGQKVHHDQNIRKTYIIQASIQLQLTCRSCISWRIPDDCAPQIQCILVSGERGPCQREASPGGLQGLLQLNWQSLSASSGGWKSAAAAPIEPWGSSTSLQQHRLWCKTTLHHPALKISMASAPQTLLNTQSRQIQTESTKTH